MTPLQDAIQWVIAQRDEAKTLLYEFPESDSRTMFDARDSAQNCLDVLIEMERRLATRKEES